MKVCGSRMKSRERELKKLITDRFKLAVFLKKVKLTAKASKSGVTKTESTFIGAIYKKVKLVVSEFLSGLMVDIT
jgi:hypothetical protein